MNKTNAFDESRRIAKLIFNEVYSKTFKNRKDFDEFVMELIKKNKVENAKYTYYSLYMDKFAQFNNFTVHINVVIDNCFSPVTFTFCMIWNTDGDGRKLNRFNEQGNMDNISTYIGTPAYWFDRNENTNKIMGIKDEIKVEI